MEYTREELEKVANAIEDELHGRDVEDPSIITKWLDDPEKRAILEPYLKSEEARQCLLAAGPLEGGRVLDFTEYGERAKAAKALKMLSKLRLKLEEDESWEPPIKGMDAHCFRALVKNVFDMTDMLRYYMIHVLLEEVESRLPNGPDRGWMRDSVIDMINHEYDVLSLLDEILQKYDMQ